MVTMRKQSSRAPFNTRRDTVKLKVFEDRENKVAVPPSSPQLTTVKLVSLNQQNFGQKRKLDVIFCLDKGVHLN